MVQSSILDPIQNELTPYLWLQPESEYPQLRPTVRKWILSRVDEVLEKYHPNPRDYASYVLTGSLTTYQFSDDPKAPSDCDVSVFIDSAFLPGWDRAALISLVLRELDGKKVGGTPFPIQTYIVSPKITKELLYQVGLRSGYDIINEQWIVPPERSRAHDTQKEYNGFYVFALQVFDKLEQLIKYEPERAIEYFHYLHNWRHREQLAGKGDFSEANIIWKMLAKRGFTEEMDKLTGEHTASAQWEFI
jgi:hypothetical protein